MIYELTAKGIEMEKKSVLQNFSVADFIYTDDDNLPMSGTPFDMWCYGSDPRIEESLIRDYWTYFRTLITEFLKYKNPNEITAEILDRELSDCLVYVEKLLPQSGRCLNPLGFGDYLDKIENSILSGDCSEFSSDQLLSVSMIIIIDRIISSLLKNDVLESAKLGFFFGASLAILKVANGESDHSIHSRNAAFKRHAKDPKQADKSCVLVCWETWQSNPTDYKGKAEFAKDMLAQFPNLTSQPVIERWCREWEGKTKA